MTATLTRPAAVRHWADIPTLAVGALTGVAGGMFAFAGHTTRPSLIAAGGLLVVAALAAVPNPVPWATGRWFAAAGIGAALIAVVVLFLGITFMGASTSGELVVADAAAYLAQFVLVLVGAYVLAVRFGTRKAWGR